MFAVFTSFSGDLKEYIADLLGAIYPLISSSSNISLDERHARRRSLIDFVHSRCYAKLYRRLMYVKYWRKSPMEVMKSWTPSESDRSKVSDGPSTRFGSNSVLPSLLIAEGVTVVPGEDVPFSFELLRGLLNVIHKMYEDVLRAVRDPLSNGIREAPLRRQSILLVSNALLCLNSVLSLKAIEYAFTSTTLPMYFEYSEYLSLSSDDLLTYTTTSRGCKPQAGQRRKGRQRRKE